MPSPRSMRIRFLALICVLACVVSAGLGWIAGVLGTFLYGHMMIAHTMEFAIPTPVGGWFGVVSGLIAGAVWCRIIVPLSLRQVEGLRSMSGLVGLGAGALAAILLHATLMLTEGELRLNAVAVGLGMQVPTGLVLGVIGGHLCRLAVTTHWAYPSEPRPRRRAPYDRPLPGPGPDFMEQLDVRSRFHPRRDFRDEYDA